MLGSNGSAEQARERVRHVVPGGIRVPTFQPSTHLSATAASLIRGWPTLAVS